MRRPSYCWITFHLLLYNHSVHWLIDPKCTKGRKCTSQIELSFVPSIAFLLGVAVVTKVEWYTSLNSCLWMLLMGHLRFSQSLETAWCWHNYFCMCKLRPD